MEKRFKIVETDTENVIAGLDGVPANHSVFTQHGSPASGDDKPHDSLEVGESSLYRFHSRGDTYGKVIRIS